MAILLLEDKLNGLIPINRNDLKELVNSWGRTNSFECGNIKECESTDCYPLENLDVSQIKSMEDVFMYSLYNGDTNEFIKVSAYFNKFLNKLNNLFKQCGHNYVLSSTKQLWRSSFFLKVVSLSQKNDSDINKKSHFLFSKWNVSNVTNFSYMFYSSKFNGDLSKWDVSNVKKTYYMFSKSKFNGDTNEFIKVSAYFNKFLNKLNNLFKQCGLRYVFDFKNILGDRQRNENNISKLL